METKILLPNRTNIDICAQALLRGELVAFPTETVYGLGANALDETAVKKIYEAKGRPGDNPLIVHLGSKDDIAMYTEITPNAQRLIEVFMPGPITIVLGKKPNIPDIVTGGRNTIGIRIPQNEVAIKLLKTAGVPVCAPSANTSTRPSPTAAQHVFDDLFGKIGYILEGGNCDIGIESTIIDVSTMKPTLLRKGKISQAEIESVLGQRVALGDNSGEALCPGLKYKHYSPKAKVIMVKNSNHWVKDINDLFIQQSSLGCKVYILCYNKDMNNFPHVATVAMGNDDLEYAQNFYAALRQLDKKGADTIICCAPGQSDMGTALYNRMYKSAGGTLFEGEE